MSPKIVSGRPEGTHVISSDMRAKLPLVYFSPQLKDSAPYILVLRLQNPQASIIGIATYNTCNKHASNEGDPMSIESNNLGVQLPEAFEPTLLLRSWHLTRESDAAYSSAHGIDRDSMRYATAQLERKTPFASKLIS